MADDKIKQPHGGAIKPPWKKGESGNPSGRPKAHAFRAKCRRLAEKLIDSMENMEPAEAAKAAAVLEVVADRGGYLAVDTSLGLLLEALQNKQLTAAQRAELARSLSDGEEEEPAALEDVKAEGEE